MKNIVLILIHVACASILVTAACSNPVKSKLPGKWLSKNGDTRLKITDKQFTMDSDSPVPEDYFMKDDSIFTSFEGNQPYTKFVIKQLDDHNLKLAYPDSTVVEFVR